MSDWYRNETWDAGIGAHFREKLRRARDKGQYLRIQAAKLAKSHPAVALDLLDQYFSLPLDFDAAWAFVFRAEAFEALGRIDDAVASYRAALDREDQFPGCVSTAYVDLPCLIVKSKIRAQHPFAREVLERHRERTLFPNSVFRWHAAYAIILWDNGEEMLARESMRIARETADRGFRYHPAVGLVDQIADAELLEQLSQFEEACK